MRTYREKILALQAIENGMPGETDADMTARDDWFATELMKIIDSMLPEHRLLVHEYEFNPVTKFLDKGVHDPKVLREILEIERTEKAKKTNDEALGQIAHDAAGINLRVKQEAAARH